MVTDYPTGISFQLRTATAEDAAAMRSLARNAYAGYVPRMEREPVPMVADYVDIAAAGSALLAVRGSDLLGMLVTAVEADAVLVENIAVSTGVQGSGLGSMLLHRAEVDARALGRRWVRLFTNEAMTENLAFYARRGYVETHRAVEDGYRRVHLRKDLSSGVRGG